MRRVAHAGEMGFLWGQTWGQTHFTNGELLDDSHLELRLVHQVRNRVQRVARILLQLIQLPPRQHLLHPTQLSISRRPFATL